MNEYQRLQALAKVNIPEARRGAVEIRRVTVSEEDAKWQCLRAVVSGSGRGAPVGTYTQLIRNGELWMSDTPDEIRDHMYFILKAQGSVLIHGLGLGVCLAPVLSKPEVERVTVVDIDPDVIALVAPTYNRRFGSRLEIIHGDALTHQWPRGARWDFVWHDIWPSICEDNLETMARLHRRFGRRCGWQDSWCRDRILSERRRTRDAFWRH